MSFRPFEPSPETELLNDFAAQAEESRRIASPDFVPAFEPAPQGETRCPAWSVERKLVGCTRERGHEGPHANHTIPGWVFTDARLIETREEWVAYLDWAYPAD